MKQWLKLFEDHEEYDDHVQQMIESGGGLSQMKNEVGRCIQERHVHYDPVSQDPRLIVTYDIIDDSEPIYLYNSSPSWYTNVDSTDYGKTVLPPTLGNYFDDVEIDGIHVSIEDIDANDGKYQFTIGEHVAKYTLKDPTTIPQEAFDSIEEIVGVIIPSSVEKIMPDAFEYCGISRIHIPSSVKYIGACAFESQYSNGSDTLYEVNISDGCEMMFGFNWNYNLISIRLPSTLKYIGGETFEYSSIEEIIIPEGVERIGLNGYANSYGGWGYTFDYCEKLHLVSLPSTLRRVEYNEFYGCPLLPVEDGMQYADTYLVKAMDKTLATYTIKPGTKFIGTGAFEDCLSMTHIEIPDEVIQISNFAFYNCPLLATINIPSSVKYIDNDAFGLPSNKTSALPVIDGIQYADTCLIRVVDKTRTTYNIKPGTRFIHDGAFSGCTNMTQITIPDTVEQIGQYTFTSCTSLQSLHIPASVKYIGNGDRSDEGDPHEFGIHNPLTQYCTSLVSITVDPANPYYDSRDNCNGIVTSITNVMFEYCKNTVIPGTVKWIINPYDLGRKQKNIIISEGVEVIERFDLFPYGGGDAVESISLPSTLKWISLEMMEGWSSPISRIHDITFPENINYISLRITTQIDKTQSLQWIRFTGMHPPCINNTFYDLGSQTGNDRHYWNKPQEFTIYVPAEAIDNYTNRDEWARNGNGRIPDNYWNSMLPHIQAWPGT